jgi:hypothetical protein
VLGASCRLSSHQPPAKRAKLCSVCVFCVLCVVCSVLVLVGLLSAQLYMRRSRWYGERGDGDHHDVTCHALSFLQPRLIPHSPFYLGAFHMRAKGWGVQAEHGQPHARPRHLAPSRGCPALVVRLLGQHIQLHMDIDCLYLELTERSRGFQVSSSCKRLGCSLPVVRPCLQQLPLAGPIRALPEEIICAVRRVPCCVEQAPINDKNPSPKQPPSRNPSLFVAACRGMQVFP